MAKSKSHIWGIEFRGRGWGGSSEDCRWPKSLSHSCGCAACDVRCASHPIHDLNSKASAFLFFYFYSFLSCDCVSASLVEEIGDL